MIYFDEFIDNTGHAEIPSIATDYPEYYLYDCNEFETIITKIKEHTFKNNIRLSSVKIPDSVEEIGQGAFEGCKNLASIVIPDSVTEIRSGTFIDCESLVSIEIPNSVTKIDSSAFKGCTSLASIKIPNSVTKIGSNAFEGCTSLASIKIPDSVTEIGNSAFKGCARLASIEIPNSVTKIAEQAFEDCTGLASIVIPDSVTEIGICAFGGCECLVSIKIPDSVTGIGDGAFQVCKNLASIVIPDSVTEIGICAFSGCTSLASIKISNCVEVIGEYTFYGCIGLTTIQIPNSVTKIAGNAFDDCSSLKNVYINSKVPRKDLLSGLLSNIDHDIVLHVPIGTGYAYRHFDGLPSNVQEVIADISYRKNTKLKSNRTSENVENKQKRYLFFDTETSGLPLSFKAPASDTSNWPRLVQLSWIIQDENGNPLSQEDYIIKPEGFTIPISASSIHGITTERALQEGTELDAVLQKFINEANKADIIVGHNVEFDLKVVGCECFRKYGENKVHAERFIDTMKESTNFCALPSNGYSDYKYPKLQELHQILFGEGFEDAHNSNADVEATAKCFWELIKRQIISLP